MLVSIVHPVTILSAPFCVICSLLLFESDTSGNHMVETYSSMGLVMTLYDVSIVFFPHVVDVCALSCCDLYVFVVFECGVDSQSLYFWLMFMRSVICGASCVLYSAGSGVKRMHVVLSGL